MLVEVLIAYTDHTWNTEYVEISKNTPFMSIKEASETEMKRILEKEGIEGVVLVSFYSLPDPREDYE